MMWGRWYFEVQRFCHSKIVGTDHLLICMHNVQVYKNCSMKTLALNGGKWQLNFPAILLQRKDPSRAIELNRMLGRPESQSLDRMKILLCWVVGLCFFFPSGLKTCEMSSLRWMLCICELCSSILLLQILHSYRSTLQQHLSEIS